MNGDTCGDPDVVCSHNSFDPHTRKYQDVLTDGTLNYQMFAFCPNVDRRKCGIPNDDQEGFKLHAELGERSSRIASTEIRYREGTQHARQYDACHYEITSSPDITEDEIEELRDESPAEEVYLYFKLIKNREMNVYIYEGIDRLSATKGITPGNV